jgi:large exoprotein involved in heme utilization and adhesion
MEAGVAYAKTWNLRPGVALSADQMAALTGDMVWLVARTTIDRVAGLYVTGDGAAAGGTLAVSAGRDLNLVAAQVGNAAKDGGTVISAGRDVNFGTVTTSSSNTLVWDVNNRRSDSANADVGSQVQAAGAITLKAGADINARAANVQAGAALVAIAGNNINLVAGVNAATLDEAHQHDEKTFLHRETITTRDTLDRTSALGTCLGGDTINLAAGSDIKITGSSVVGGSRRQPDRRQGRDDRGGHRYSQRVARAQRQGERLPQRGAGSVSAMASAPPRPTKAGTRRCKSARRATSWKAAAGCRRRRPTWGG